MRFRLPAAGRGVEEWSRPIEERARCREEDADVLEGVRGGWKMWDFAPERTHGRGGRSVDGKGGCGSKANAPGMEGPAVGELVIAELDRVGA